MWRLFLKWGRGKSSGWEEAWTLGIGLGGWGVRANSLTDYGSGK